MNTITADTNLQRSLSGLESLTEIRDSRGKVIGYFSPFVGSSAAADYTRAAAHFDVQEMKRRKESGEEGLTTAEMLVRFKSLEN